MTDETLRTIIIATPPTLAALGALLVSLRNRKRTKNDIEEVKSQVFDIKVSIDGRMEQLLDVTRGLAKSQGHAEGQEQERGEERARGVERELSEKADHISETVEDTRERVKVIQAEVVGAEGKE